MPVSTDKVNLRDVAKEIASRSTVSTIDAYASIEALTQVILSFLSRGNIVDLGDFGTFRITISSVGSDTAEEVRSSNVKKLNLIFRPGKEFKTEIKKFKITKEDKMKNK